MTCDNPNCIACAYQTAHPEEQRTHLIFTAAHILKLVVGTLAETSLRMAQIEKTVKSVGIDLEENPGVLQTKYNELFNRMLRLEIADQDYEITAGLKVLFALLPSDVMAGAWECYTAHITQRATEADKADEVDAALANAHKFFDDFVRTGRAYLEGVSSDLPSATAPHPTTLQ